MTDRKIQKQRLQKEMQDLQKNQNSRFSAGPINLIMILIFIQLIYQKYGKSCSIDYGQNKNIYLYAYFYQNDMFNWHFTMRGPKDSPFEKGIYHGKIEFPVEYPFKPPDLYFFTPNGRYEINTKICLSVTRFHPEEWSPSWTLRTMLEGIISTFPEFDRQMMGLGSLKIYSDQDLKKLALQSQKFVCDKCGPIIDLLEQTDDLKEPQKQNDSPQNNDQQNLNQQKEAEQDKINQDQNEQKEQQVINLLFLFYFKNFTQKIIKYCDIHQGLEKEVQSTENIPIVQKQEPQKSQDEENEQSIKDQIQQLKNSQNLERMKEVQRQQAEMVKKFNEFNDLFAKTQEESQSNACLVLYENIQKQQQELEKMTQKLQKSIEIEKMQKKIESHLKQKQELQQEKKQVEQQIRDKLLEQIKLSQNVSPQKKLETPIQETSSELLKEPIIPISDLSSKKPQQQIIDDPQQQIQEEQKAEPTQTSNFQQSHQNPESQSGQYEETKEQRIDDDVDQTKSELDQRFQDYLKDISGEIKEEMKQQQEEENTQHNQQRAPIGLLFRHELKTDFYFQDFILSIGCIMLLTYIIYIIT